jgi:uncharacterized protein YjbJ (UPF0337 family)
MYGSAPNHDLIAGILCQLGHLQFRKRRDSSEVGYHEHNERRRNQIGGAKIAWGKLTEDELLKSEGHAQKLAGLVQERYAVTREEADTQVEKFLAKIKI